MSYGTQQLYDLEALREQFHDAVAVNNKTKAMKVLSEMTEVGLSVQANHLFTDIIYSMVADHHGEPLLGGGEYTEITQEDMNGGITGINYGNHD